MNKPRSYACPVPMLWPSRIYRENCKSIVSWSAQHLRLRGWNPKLPELTEYMKSTKLAVHYYVTEAIGQGLLEWRGKSHRREVVVTPKGWASLRRQPTVPWCNRPSDSLRDTIANKVMRKIKNAEKQTIMPNPEIGHWEDDGAPCLTQ